MKTLGVLGGLGPQATMDLEARLHAVAHELIPPRRSGGYPPLLVYYYRHPPFVLDADRVPVQPLAPDPRLLEAARRLGVWADLLVVAANAPHVFLDDIREAFGGPVLSMVELTLDEVARRGWRQVGVLGLGRPQAYLDGIARSGATAVVLPDALQSRLDEAIFRLMEGARDGDAAEAAVRAVRRLHPDGIILGCTEIPLMLGDAARAPDLLNPADLLARTAVEQALA